MGMEHLRCACVCLVLRRLHVSPQGKTVTFELRRPEEGSETRFVQLDRTFQAIENPVAYSVKVLPPRLCRDKTACDVVVLTVVLQPNGFDHVRPDARTLHTACYSRAMKLIQLADSLNRKSAPHATSLPILHRRHEAGRRGRRHTC